jgi:hypothetical protein
MKDTLWHDGLHSIQIGLASTNSPIPRPRRSEIFVAEFGVLEPLLSFQNPRDVNLVGFQPACTFDINNDQLLRIAHSRPSSRLLALGNTEIKISLKGSVRGSKLVQKSSNSGSPSTLIRELPRSLNCGSSSLRFLRRLQEGG